MVIRLTRFPVLDIVISGRSLAEIGSPFRAQASSMGRSPFTMVHTAETASPQFAGSSPIENGAICGATEKYPVKATSAPSSSRSIARGLYDAGMTGDDESEEEARSGREKREESLRRGAPPTCRSSHSIARYYYRSRPMRPCGSRLQPCSTRCKCIRPRALPPRRRSPTRSAACSS